MKRGSDGYYRKDIWYNGKSYPVRAKTIEDLWQKVALKKHALQNGEIGYNGNTSVARWMSEYLETYKKNSVGPKQYETYCSLNKNYVIPQIGTMRIKDVLPIHLQSVLNQCRGKSESLATKLRNLLRMAFRQAHKNKMILDDPSEDLALPETTAGTHRSITDFEREHILALCETHRAGLWVLTILYCGLRPGEANTLRWDNIDWDTKTMTVLTAAEAKSNRVKSTKTDAGIRLVPIPTVLLEKLRAAWDAVQDQRELKSPQDESHIYVFTQPTTGRRHTHTSYIQMWRSFYRKLDIHMGAKTFRGAVIPETSVIADDLYPYCLRHTYGTDLQTAGVSINVAKELMGHDDIKVTSKIYTHLSLDAFLSAAQRIDAFYSGCPDQNSSPTTSSDNIV